VRIPLSVIWFLSPRATERWLEFTYFIARYLPKLFYWLGFALGWFDIFLRHLSLSDLFGDQLWIMEPVFFGMLSYFIGVAVVKVIVWTPILFPFFLLGAGFALYNYLA